jgi:serine/threonine-protein kinase
MSVAGRSEATGVTDEEKKLLQALVGRGWVAAEEVQEFVKERSAGDGGLKELLTQLVKANLLTPNQARRTFKDLETYLQQQIPGYELRERLGQGSMGRVFLAQQISMNRPVAIKILHPKLSTPGYIERFIREAHVAAKLSSNNIVQAIDVGTVGSLNYFVMEYVEGTTVKAELEKGKIYPESEAVEIGLQIAQALDHAHRRQLIHRDVKPGNIIVTKDGIAKLADLGLARHVEDPELARAERGATIGTPYYIAPELIGGKQEADIRADIYSLGATLYHMVTGRPPFPSQRIDDVLRAHLHEELVPPDHVNTKLSAGLGEVVEYAMIKERGQRYQTPADLVLDLECLFRGEPPQLARPATQYATLEELARGEAEASGAAEDGAAGSGSQPVLAIIVLLVMLGASILLNLILLAD